MKAIISGPRSGLTDDGKLPWMHIKVDLEELPKEGEVIILNNGTSYYVKNITWWVDGPQNDAYWARGDYEVDGQFQTVQITVEPDNRRDRYGYPAGLEDGQARGGELWLAELRGLVDLTKAAIASGGTYDGLGLIDTWLAQQETNVATRKAAEDTVTRRAAEAFAAASKAADERRSAGGEV